MTEKTELQLIGACGSAGIMLFAQVLRKTHDIHTGRELAVRHHRALLNEKHFPYKLCRCVAWYGVLVGLTVERMDLALSRGGYDSRPALRTKAELGYFELRSKNCVADTRLYDEADRAVRRRGAKPAWGASSTCPSTTKSVGRWCSEIAARLMAKHQAFSLEFHGESQGKHFGRQREELGYV